MGIGPASEAWEAMFRARKRSNWRLFDVLSIPELDSNWISKLGLGKPSATVKRCDRRDRSSDFQIDLYAR